MFILIMGVAGSGKSTIGARLALALGWTFIDADDFHSTENVRKMAAGIPLSDEDRRPWLDDLCVLVRRYAACGGELVLACSALKSSYRDVLLSANPEMITIYLKADADLLRERLSHRSGHYMSSDLLQSQLDMLEEPVDATAIPAAWPPDKIVAAIRSAIGV
jgi:gluconokinase